MNDYKTLADQYFKESEKYQEECEEKNLLTDITAALDYTKNNVEHALLHLQEYIDLYQRRIDIGRPKYVLIHLYKSQVKRYQDAYNKLQNDQKQQ